MNHLQDLMPKLTPTFCALILSLAAGTAAHCASGKASSHYQLTQVSAETEDTITVSFNQAALRMVWPKHHMVLVAKAPNWKVVVFNETTKRKYVPTAEQFLEFGLRSSDAIPQLLPPITQQKAIQSKLSVTAIDASAGRVELNDDDVEQFFQTKEMSHPTLYILSYHYIVWNETVPPAVSRIMQCVYRMPLNAHLPLYLRRTISDGTRRYELSTTHVEKQPGPVNAEEPVGYTITHDPGPVIMGDYNDAVTNMGQQWFDGETKAPGKAQDVHGTRSAR
jgi:hypothetical protein